MGSNNKKILQNINQSHILQPVQIASGVSKAAVGDNHLIYLDLNGTLWGRGKNENGELGQPAGNEYKDPVAIISGGVSDLVAGSYFSAVLLEDGRILTFGNNEFGQLGTGDLIWTRTPTKIPGLRVKHAAANNNGTYFVDLNHSLWSVGVEDYGDLGDGGGSIDLATPVRVVAGGVDSVQTRDNHVL
jgi:alpha-tubulin suppressor-like RCC1 family protein